MYRSTMRSSRVVKIQMSTFREGIVFGYMCPKIGGQFR
jgi:hypothetical protein